MLIQFLVDSSKLLFVLQSPVLDVIGEHEALALVWAALPPRDRSPASVCTELRETGHGGAIWSRPSSVRDAVHQLLNQS